MKNEKKEIKANVVSFMCQKCGKQIAWSHTQMANITIDNICFCEEPIAKIEYSKLPIHQR